MEIKLINTKNYLLIVDDSEIKEGDWFVNNRSASYYIDKKAPESSQRFALNSNAVFINPKKIIAHLPLKNSSILEGVDLLPPLEDEVKKLAFDYTSISQSHRRGFIDGYNKAKEKYKYTEKQLDDAISWATTKAREGIITHWDIDNFIQSLQQPKMPIGFKCEMETTSYADDACASDGGYYTKRYSVTEPKTTTNSQGLTQWVGEYIY